MRPMKAQPRSDVAAAPALPARIRPCTMPFAVRADFTEVADAATGGSCHTVRPCGPDAGIVRGADPNVAVHDETASTQGRGIGAGEAVRACLWAALGTRLLPLARVGRSPVASGGQRPTQGKASHRLREPAPCGRRRERAPGHQSAGNPWMASFPTESGGGGQTPGQRKSPSSVEMRLRPSIPAYERHVNIESAARCRLGEGTDVSQAEHVALHAAIATRGGYCWWDVDHAGRVVTLSSPEEQTS
jgi:hypothetical protein